MRLAQVQESVCPAHSRLQHLEYHVREGIGFHYSFATCLRVYCNGTGKVEVCDVS